MPKLNEVITVILSSLSTAQHQSNKVSKQFAESYQTDEIMKYFALPNATMSEADITLRYAIKDLVETAMPHFAIPQDISSESRFAARIRAFKIIDLLMHNEKIQALFKGTDINVRHVAMSCVNNISQVIYEGNKIGLDEKEITKEIANALQKEFDKYPEIADQFATVFPKVINSSEVVKTIYACIKDDIDNIKIPINKPKGASKKTKDSSDTMQDLEIIIDNEVLQKLPESVIQTIHLKATLKNYRWLVTENSSAGEFILVS